MALITKLEEIQKFTSALTMATSIPDDFRPSMETVEDSAIVDIIGMPLLAELRAAYAASILDVSPTAMPAKYASLWTAVNKVAVPLAVIDFISITMASSNSGGTTEVVGGARMWVTNVKKDQLQVNAQRSTDNLFEFLEANKGDYPSWTSSRQYTIFKSLLVQTTAQFDEVIEIGMSRQLFRRFRAVIAEVEEKYIIPQIGVPFYNTLIAALKATPSAEQELAIKALRKAIVRLAMASSPLPLQIDADGIMYVSTDAQDSGGRQSKRAANDSTLDAYKNQQYDNGLEFLSAAKSYLDTTASATIFPEYFTSSYYQAPGSGDLSSLNDNLTDIFVL